jgi:hypothetical protein
VILAGAISKRVASNFAMISMPGMISMAMTMIDMANVTLLLAWLLVSDAAGVIMELSGLKLSQNRRMLPIRLTSYGFVLMA